ncbi:MAG: flagellar basal body P-ring formation chaperone FlgA, partial [Planctomycetota bacterium]
MEAVLHCRRDVFPRRAATLALLAAVVAAVQVAPTGQAAELRLHSRCEVAGPVVTLGDVAEILTSDAAQGQQLAALELFPAPSTGQSRFVRQREIEDLLLLRGTNLLGLHFSGSGQVQIARLEKTPQVAPPRQPAASVVRRAERLVREAVVQYLQKQTSQEEPWSVQVELDDRNAQAIEAVSVAGEKISIRGGQPPWTGSQRFEVLLESPGGPVRFEVQAKVALPPATVVTLRSLSRGAVIQPGDVTLQRNAQAAGQEEGFQSLDELVGKETTRAIPAGKVVERGFVRSPLMVRRGQVVTVHARRSGILVRTT